MTRWLVAIFLALTSSAAADTMRMAVTTSFHNSGLSDVLLPEIRADLGLDPTLSRACQHPDNPWSLHGLHECLVRRGATDEAKMVKQRLDLAGARADVPITCSCFCRMERAA